MRILLLFLALFGAPALAQDCEVLARQAETRHAIPEGLLVAIARVESSRNGRAWPWTLNVAGQGHWFDTAAEAEAALSRLIEAGRSDMDAGCMQVNWRWHGQSFESARAILDPATNVDHAARYLVSLRREMGDWEAAVRAYHSRDPQRGARYLGRVAAARAALDLQSPRPADPVEAPTQLAAVAAGPMALLQVATRRSTADLMDFAESRLPPSPPPALPTRRIALGAPLANGEDPAVSRLRRILEEMP